MKRIYMMLYGEPGVGKSVFACKAPKPYFITTDGNYEWLEDFGADPKAYTQVSSWEEAKKLFASNFDGYDTIVVDLLEDLFKWCESEFCVRSKIDHISDIGYGKGYDITRNEFFIEISKLLAKNKNVILISHGVTEVVKDRRGVEHTKYKPSSRLPDKVLDMIEGRLRYCLRCYLKADETEDGKLVKNRYLSLVPKENEFGIIRGVDENTIPHDIPLDWNEFAKAIKYDVTPGTTEYQIKVDIKPTTIEVVKPVETKPVEIKEVEPIVEVTVPESEPVKEEPSKVAEEVVEKPVEAPTKVETVEQPKIINGEDKLAAIRAKLAAMKNQNK